MKKSPPGATPDFPDTEPASMLPTDEEPSLPGKPSQSPTKLRAPTSEAFGLSLAPVETTLYEVMAIVSKDNRVSPQPTRWLEFYRILQDGARGKPLPTPPLTGSAWASTPAMAKRMCFREQLEWADKNGCLQPAFEFLQGLPDTDWHYTA